MDCSKLMSGLSLVEMMLLAVSRCTSVLKGVELAQAFPAVVEGLAQLALEPPDPVRARAAAPAPLRLDQPARLAFVLSCVAFRLLSRAIRHASRTPSTGTLDYF